MKNKSYHLSDLFGKVTRKASMCEVEFARIQVTPPGTFLKKEE